MPRLAPILLFAGAVLLVAFATLAGPESRPSPSKEWNNEALFDTTSTRAELMEMGRAAVSLSHFTLAEIYYQEVLLRSPEDVEAMCELAALYHRTGRLEYARGLLLRAGSLVPHREDIPEARRRIEKELRVLLAHEVDSLMAASQFASALPRLSLLLSIDPDNGRYHAAKARCLAAVGESDAALSSVDLALAKDPREEYQRLRDEISAQHEERRIADLESSAKRLLASKEWMRDEAADVLQAILAQDPSNEWAREQFRALAGQPLVPPPVAPPPMLHQIFDAAREVLPGVARSLERHLTAIVILIAIVLMFRSPLSRALVKRAHDPSPLSGDLATIDVAEALRLVNASALTGVLVIRAPEGTARVYFDSGDPVHCEAFGRQGHDAISYLTKNVEEGTFAMKNGRIKTQRTIDQPLDLILAEGVTTTKERDAAARRNLARREQGRKKSRMAELLETKSDKS
jgi:tetratricopeptide (TPR) repeat protein